MLPSVERLYRFFKLEVERSFDNRSVFGGLEKILPNWEAQARSEGLPETLIDQVRKGLARYPDAAGERAALLGEIWEGVTRLTDTPEHLDLHPNRPVPAAAPASAPRPAPAREAAPASPSAPRPSPAPAPVRLGLSAPLTVIQGVGPRHAETLSRLGLSTLEDLLFYFPRRYEDYSTIKPINQVFYNEVVTLIGTIKSIAPRPLRNRRRSIVDAVLSDGNGDIRLTWFNQPWIATRLKPGTPIVLSGKADQYLGRLVIINPEWEPADTEQLHTNRIVPIYPLTATITQRWLRKVMFQTVGYWSPRVEDFLPERIRGDHELLTLAQALQQVHFPSSQAELARAQKRLAFDEIFLLQVGVLQQKAAWTGFTARQFTLAEDRLQAQLHELPYRLTGAQQKVLADVRADLDSGRPMNRLLQGDVGSGKTVVAALASAIVTQGGSQAAILAPTSILAEQHLRSFSRLLADPGNPGHVLAPGQVRLLLGSTPAAERRSVLSGLESGEVRLVVGTHALLEEAVRFQDLQFVVIDEQHRFGVQQRSALRSKGTNPHLLVMTATPIPRSLALTVYGDLDLSVIDEFPPGRQVIDTIAFLPREREQAYQQVRAQVDAGRQGFIIYPLVEQGDQDEAKAAVEEHARLSEEVFRDYRLGLLHGRMKQDEKDRVMGAFRDRQLDLLVSTSVVEVGVDVPNATIMLVEGANRFGLSQLHQFRGRVGRGSEKSYCLLIPDTDTEAENLRLKAMCQTSDGFRLAEMDLQQRGPGDFLGTRQSGFADLRMASLTDVKMIEMARKAAQALFNEDPSLAQPENQNLAAAMRHFWEDGKGDIS